MVSDSGDRPPSDVALRGGVRRGVYVVPETHWRWMAMMLMLPEGSRVVSMTIEHDDLELRDAHELPEIVKVDETEPYFGPGPAGGERFLSASWEVAD